MRRLLATAAIAAAVFVPATAHADSRSCGGVVDIDCSGYVCPTDCWQRDCLVWVDVFHNANTAQCVGAVTPA
jgi:hypothetical protein